MKSSVRTLTRAAVLTAVTLVLTLFVRIPLPSGYLNLGDVGVFLCALLLPLPYAPMAAGLGGMLADLIDYPAYAPATLLIKGLAALAYILLNKLFRNKLQIVSLLLASLFVPLGYFLFELWLYRAYAFVDLLPNLLQGVVGAILAYGIYRAAEKLKILPPNA